MTEPTLAATASPKDTSLWEDFIDVLYAPTRVFERRRGRGFGAQLFILAALFGIVAAATMSLTRPLMDRQMDLQLSQMRKNGMSEEQVAGARAFTERIAPISAVGAPSIGLLIVVPITALVLLGIARAAGAASLDFSGAGLISTYSIVPALLTALVGAALLLVIDAENLPLLQQMTVGPALLLGRDASPVLVAVATRFGVAEIWSVFITAAGVRVLGKRSAGSAMTIALLNWALGTVVAVLLGLRAAASMG
jgi:hypothetical protein